MKNKIYILGIISCLILTVGALFKMQHWPYANILIVTGGVFYILIFLSVALRASYKEENQHSFRLLYIFAFICAAFAVAGMIFKVIHLPGADIVQIISIPLPFVLFLPAYLITIRKNETVNYNHLLVILFFLAYMAVMSSSLSLNISVYAVDDIIRVAYVQKENAGLTKLQTTLIVPDSLKNSALMSETDKLCNAIDKARNDIAVLCNPSNQIYISEGKEPDYFKLYGKTDVSFTYHAAFNKILHSLKADVILYKSFLDPFLKIVKPSTSCSVLKMLNVEDIHGKSWEVYSFQGLRLVSVIEKLEELRNNVCSAQFLLAEDCFKN